jgi:glutathione S-transferase
LKAPSLDREFTSIVVGYYNLRGKAQVPRLLLEYLKVDYEDKIFTLPEWQKYSQEETQDFVFPVLPFLREGNFVCTDSVPMCTYIINRFGCPELLGRNLKDRAIIEMYFWTIPYM